MGLKTKLERLLYSFFDTAYEKCMSKTNRNKKVGRDIMRKDTGSK